MVQQLLNTEPFLLLDGGLATELEAGGYDLRDTLWSARLLLDDPEAILQVHQDYLTAGADVIISASYQATIPGFMSRGLTEQEAHALLRRAVEIAQEARDTFWQAQEADSGRIRPLVAASVGPYGAYLADGSEYRGDYALDEAGLVDFHRARLHILAEARPDLLACETIPSAAEARALAQLLPEVAPLPAWVSFSCRDEAHISDGTPLVEAVRPLLAVENVVAVGVNCTAPRFVPPLLAALRQVTTLPLVAYPNSGEQFDAVNHCWLGTSDPLDFAAAAQEWLAAGARLLGGCCRTRPEHIRQMRRALVGN